MNGNRIAFWGITYRQLGWVLLLYGVSILFYDMALSISQRVWAKQTLGAYFVSELPRILLDYSFKLLLTAPFWYLLFVRLAHWPLMRRVMLHIALLPLFVTVWQLLYYATSDALGIGRLQGDGQVWDTYIGALFYLVQFGIFHAYAYYRDFQRQREREAQLRELALKSELSALKAQLNPHFLYNVFNTISASVPPAQEHTREMLAELSDMFRYQLQAARSETVTVEEEIDFVRKYLALEKARFGNRLQVSIDVADETLNLRMPPMLLQPLVENSVKHGIAPLIEGGRVSVRIRRQGGQLQVEVADTGVGLTEKPLNGQGGVGLANTRLRLEKMYGTTVRLLPNEPQGARAEFDMPVLG